MVVSFLESFIAISIVVSKLVDHATKIHACFSPLKISVFVHTLQQRVNKWAQKEILPWICINIP